MLQPGQTLSAGLRFSEFYRAQSAFWSTSANPGTYPSGSSGSTCTHGSYTQTVPMTNSQSSPRTAWFVVKDAPRALSVVKRSPGSFTLSWTITALTSVARACEPCGPNSYDHDSDGTTACRSCGGTSCAFAVGSLVTGVENADVCGMSLFLHGALLTFHCDK